MRKFQKIIIIIIISILSVYLLFVFILFNFPYQSLVNRLDNYLQTHYEASLTVDNVIYRYPLKLQFENLRIVHENNFFIISAQSLFIRYRIFSFSRMKSFEMSGNGIDVKSDFFTMSEASLNLMSRIRLLRLVRGIDGDNIDSVRLIVGGANVERVLFSGFEFNALRLKQIQFFLKGSGEEFAIERGILSVDVLTSEITGTIGFDAMDITVNAQLTDDFFRKYGNLRSIVNSVFDDGKLQIKLEGSIGNPRFRIVKG